MAFIRSLSDRIGNGDEGAAAEGGKAFARIAVFKGINRVKCSYTDPANFSRFEPRDDT